MAHFDTVFDIGDFVKPRRGPRRAWSFRIDEIRVTRFTHDGAPLVLIEYRTIFSTGTPGRWMAEKHLELVRAGFVVNTEPETVREMKNAKDAG